MTTTDTALTAEFSEQTDLSELRNSWEASGLRVAAIAYGMEANGTIDNSFKGFFAKTDEPEVAKDVTHDHGNNFTLEV